MSTWPDLVRYIRSNYEIASEEDDSISLQVKTQQRRSQFVLISHTNQLGDGAEWTQISAPCGDLNKFGEAGLLAALRRVERMVVGALVLNEDTLIIREAILINDLTVDSFELVLKSIVLSADFLWNHLMG